MNTKSKFILLSVAILGFICFTAFKTLKLRVNFSGIWTINMEKSDFGSVPEVDAKFAAPAIIKIHQLKDAFIIQSTYDSVPVGNGAFMGIPKSLDTLGFDGKSKEAFWTKGGLKVLKTLTWLEGTNSLTISTKQAEVKEGENPIISWKETYLLSDDGKSLQYNAVKGTNQSGLVKVVYNKK